MSENLSKENKNTLNKHFDQMKVRQEQLDVHYAGLNEDRDAIQKERILRTKKNEHNQCILREFERVLNMDLEQIRQNLDNMMKGAPFAQKHVEAQELMQKDVTEMAKLQQDRIDLLEKIQQLQNRLNQQSEMLENVSLNTKTQEEAKEENKEEEKIEPISQKIPKSAKLDTTNL